MGLTFDKRLQRRSIMDRLGQSNNTGGYSQPIRDLRNKIGNAPRAIDVRNMLNRRRQNQQNIRKKVPNRNRIGVVTLKTRNEFPFLIPRRTVKNDYFNRSSLNNPRSARQNRNQLQQNRIPIIRTIINQQAPSIPSLPAIFRNLSSQSANLLPLPKAISHALSPIQGFRVEIKNLLPSVSLEDVYELFSGVGTVRSCNIVRPGHGEVIFTNAQDAYSAVSRYNGRELDGRPMKVTLTTPVDATLLTTQPNPRKIAADNRAASISQGRPTKQPIELDMEIVNRALHHIMPPSVSTSRRPVDFNVNLF